MANKFLPANFMIPNFNVSPMEYAKAGKNWVANQWADIATQAELQKQRASEYIRQQKANAKIMAEEIKAEAKDAMAKGKSAIKGIGTKTAPKVGSSTVKEGLDTIYGKPGPSIMKGIGTSSQSLPHGTFSANPTNAFGTPITKGSIGQIVKQIKPMVGTAGRILGPLADVASTGYGILSGNYDKAQTVGHLGGSILNIGGMGLGNPLLVGAGLALHGITGLNKGYREGLKTLDPAKLARGEYATDGKGKKNLYGGELTTNVLKNPEYNKALEEGGLGALYDLVYPNLLNEVNQIDGTENKDDYSQLFLSNKPVTSLPPLPAFLEGIEGAGFHVNKGNNYQGQTIPNSNLTPVNEAPVSSDEDILNFISKIKNNPTYQKENGLWDNILGYGTSDIVRALDNTPTEEQTQQADPVLDAIKEQLSSINNQLIDANKFKRDPVRDAWIANYFGQSPFKIFGYPQSGTEQLVDIQKALANQLTIYDKLTSTVQDKEQQDAMREALSKTGIDQMGLSLLMNDKTAGPYVTNVLSKYLTKDLEDEKFLRELQKIVLTQNLVGDNQMNVAKQYGVNSLLNTEASGVNARDLALIKEYLQLERNNAIQERIDRRQDAETALELMLYNKGLKGNRSSTSELTPYQQVQSWIKLYEQTGDSAYLEMAESILPGVSTNNINQTNSKIGQLNSLYK